jgi:NAD(P)-dependent dehydrogenase (short-subunit alcohol dehydrogenase family)
MSSTYRRPICVVTGAASGIGLALTHRLLNDGWDIIGVDMRSGPVIDSGNYRHHLCDLSHPASLHALCDALSQSGVTALVHCAGRMSCGGVLDTRDEDADMLWRLHDLAPLALIRALTPGLPDVRGRIVLVSSRAILGRAQRLAYAATKAAQIGLARSLAAELIGRGVTVNVVAPAAVDTPMLHDRERGASPTMHLPLGRLIAADEVAAAIAFFLGSEAGAITGQTLYICGGASLGSML